MATNEEVQMSLLHDSDKGAENKRENNDPKGNAGNFGSHQTVLSEIYMDTTQPKAPDGGWGIMVVVGGFFCNFFVDGIMFTFDIMRRTFQQDFPEVEQWEIQVMGSLIPGLYLTLAPVAGALLNRYGPRPLVMAGGLLGCIAFLGSAFVNDFYTLLFLYGVVGGIAFTLIYSPAVLAVGFYFDRLRATATGIAVCGSCFGTFVLAILMTKLYEEYGSWRGVLIICAGLVLNCCVCGALFRPLPELIIEQVFITEEEPGAGMDDQFIINKIVEEKRRQRAISRGSLDNCVITRDNRIVKLDANSQMSLASKNIGWRLAPAAHDSTDRGATADNFGLPPVRVARAQSVNRVTHSVLHLSRRSLASLQSQGVHVQRLPLGSGIMYRQDAYFTGNIQHTQRYREAQALAAATGADPDTLYAQSIMNIPPDEGGGDLDEYDGAEEEKTCCFRLIKTKSIRDALLATFDVSLLSSPTMIILCVAAFLGMLGFFTPFFFGGDYSRTHNMTATEAMWVLNSIAVANGPGRILCGILSDQPWADSLHITNFAMMLSGVLNILLPLTAHLGSWVFYVYGALFGLTISPFISLRSIIVADLLGMDKMTAAYGFLLLFMGAAAFIGSPVLVGIQQQIGYDWVFYISGGVLALSGLICVPCHRLAKWEKERAERKLRRLNGADDVTPANTPAELDQQNGSIVPDL